MKQLERRPLGASGIDVTALGYGAWAIGGLGYGDVPESDAMAALGAYLDGGGRLIDTARGYGISEILVGKALKASGVGDEVFVASKSGASLGAIIRTDCETSRFCLQRDRIDLYYIHVPPPDFDKLRRMLDTYQALKDEGKIGLVGLSQRGDAGADAIEMCRRCLDDGRVDVIQLPLSLPRQQNRPLILEARDHGVGIMARMNLEGGLLTGKYKPGHVWPDAENDWRAHRPRRNMDALLEAVQDLARRFVRPPYASMAQVALAWCLATEGVSAVIPGGKNERHVRENLSVADLPPMPAALYEELAEAGAPLGDYLKRE